MISAKPNLLICATPKTLRNFPGLRNFSTLGHFPSKKQFTTTMTKKNGVQTLQFDCTLIWKANSSALYPYIQYYVDFKHAHDTVLSLYILYVLYTYFSLVQLTTVTKKNAAQTLQLDCRVILNAKGKRNLFWKPICARYTLYYTLCNQLCTVR